MIAIFCLFWIREVLSQCNTFTESSCLTQKLYSCSFEKDQRICLANTLQKRDCLKYMSYKLCLSQERAKCYWQNNTCRTLRQAIKCTEFPQTRDACLQNTNACAWDQSSLECLDAINLQRDSRDRSCEDYYNFEVSLAACALIENLKCKLNRHVGYSRIDRNYACSTVTDPELEKIKCTQPGLSREACRQVKTQNERCIFMNSSCQPLSASSVPRDLKCTETLNQGACLSLSTIACYWSNQCLTYQLDSSQLQQVNPAACSVRIDKPYYFKEESFECKLLSEQEINVISCEQLGLNRLGCFRLARPCYFHQGKCRAVVSLEQFRCASEYQLNKIACLQNQREGEACQWSDKSQSCEDAIIDDFTKCTDLVNVNGLACRAVNFDSCKYNTQASRCETPILVYDCNSNGGLACHPADGCDAPYLNLIGCVNILQDGNLCHWKQNRCHNSFEVKAKCDDGFFQNANSCASYLGKEPCGYDPNSRTCKIINPNLFDKLKCGQVELGLNREACALIRTLGEVCHYTSRRCASYQPNIFISQPCDTLSYVNQEVCSRVKFQDEICVYDSLQKKCVQFANLQTLECRSPGVNINACQAITNPKQNCFFDPAQFQCGLANDLTKLRCQDGPSKIPCLGILTPGQVCMYDSRLSKCFQIQVNQNGICHDYQDVNAYTCTQIQHQMPDITREKSGYCQYDGLSKCEALTDFSKQCPDADPCCTKKLGINTHVCSRLSDPNTFCYFDMILGKCLEFEPQMDQQSEIQFKFNRQKHSCYQANYKLCGFINWEDSQGLAYCYQQSKESVCMRLSEQQFIEYNASQPEKFLTPESRANRNLCLSIEKHGLNIRYDSKLGKCVNMGTSENVQIVCGTPDINEGACLNLTTKDDCLWLRGSLACVQVSGETWNTINCDDLINRNACIKIKCRSEIQCPSKPIGSAACRYNMRLKKCEPQPLQQEGCEIESDFVVNAETCTKLSGGNWPCRYASDTQACTVTTVVSETCQGLGFNKYSCFAFTNGYCKWSQENNQCQHLESLDGVKCADQINQHACLGITTPGQFCVWDGVQCNSIEVNTSTTCKELQQRNQKFNEQTCYSITAPGSFCTYDYGLQNCQSELCESEPCLNSRIQLNEECEQRKGNIHFCLSRTKSHYCKWDPQQIKCSKYEPTESLPCNTANINREICLVKTNQSCRFDVSKSICEAIVIQATMDCSSLSPTTQFLYNQSSCSKISPNAKTLANREGAITFCDGLKPICQYQRLCNYNKDIDGCQIYESFQEEIKTIEQQIEKTCTVKRQWPKECNSDFSEALCISADAPCVFVGTCKHIDDVPFTELPTVCEKYSIQSCLIQNKICCTQERFQQVPLQCDVPESHYLICSSLKLDNPTNDCSAIQQIVKDYSTTPTQTLDLETLKISPMCCSRIQNGYCDYDGSTNNCRTLNKKISDCQREGLSKQACNEKQCVYQQEKCAISNSSANKSCSDFYELVNCCQTSAQLQQIKRDCVELKNQNCVWVTDNFIGFNRYRTITWNNCSSRESDPGDCISQSNVDTYFSNQLYNQSECAKCYRNSQNTRNTNHSNNNQTYNSDIQNCQSRSYNVGTYSHSCASFSSKQACEEEQPQKILECRKNKCIASNQCDNMPVMDPQNNTIVNQERINCYANCTDENQNKSFSNSCKVENSCCQCFEDAVNKLIASNAINEQQLAQNLSICSGKQDCSLQKKGCKEGIQELTFDKLNAQYELVSRPICTSSKGRGARYNEDDNICIHTDNEVPECSNLLNELSCLRSTYICVWTSSICVPRNSHTTGKETICKVVSAGGCPYIKKTPCQVIQGLCQDTQLGNSCDNISESANSRSCQVLSVPEPCYHNGQKCTKWLPGQPMLDCNTLGINEHSCLVVAKGECRFDKNAGCLEVQGYDYINTCDNFGKNACLQIKNVNCFWNATVSRCQKVDYKNVTSCENFLETNNLENLFNQSACKEIKEDNVRPKCYHSGDKCVTVTKSIKIPCYTPGINSHACLESTDRMCQFYNGICRDISSHYLGCSSNLNWLACVSQHNHSCVFKNGRCQTFNLQDGNSKMEQLSEQEGVYYSPSICLQTSLSNLPLQYDSIRYICQAVSVENLPCDSLRINRSACLEKTIGYCAFLDQACTIIKEGVLHNRETKCEASFNKVSCLAVKYQRCIFKDGHCQSAADADKCIGQMSTNQEFCRSRTDSACIFDNLIKNCKQPADNLLSCDAEGVNEIACYNNTSRQFCEFQQGRCQPFVVNVDTRCTHPINQLACSLVYYPDDLCYFDKVCKEINSSNDHDFTKCLTSIIVNKSVCKKATDVGCKYQEGYCVETSNFEDCSKENSMNQIGCVQNLTAQHCKWNRNTETCTSVVPEKQNEIVCSDIVNRTACVNIQKLDQYCQFKNHACKQVDLNAVNDCLDLQNVNHERICEKAEGVPCIYNREERSCKELSGTLNDCVRGINRAACLLNPDCEFEDHCVRRKVPLSCQNLTDPSACLETQLKCFWDGKNNECKAQVGIQSCNQFPYQSSLTLCRSFSVREGSICTRDQITMRCSEKILEDCSQAYTRELCNSIKERFCLWDKDACKSDMNKCLQQKGLPCKWLNDACQCLKGAQLQLALSYEGCLETMSYQLCLRLQHKDVYCIWQNSRCQPFQIKQTTIRSEIANVSSSVCSLVNDGRPVVFDPYNFFCRTATTNDGCKLLGINKEACIQSSMACVWQEKQCLQLF